MNFKKREPSSPRSVLEDPSRHRGPPFLPLFAAIGGIAAGLLHHRNKSKQQEEVLVASGSPSGRFSGGGSELVLHSSAMANKQQMVPVVVKTGSGREMVVPYADLTYEQQFQLQQQQQQFLAYQRGGGAPASPGIGYSPQRAPVASFGPTNGVPSSMVLNIYTGGDTPQETPPPPPPPPERGPGAAVMDWLKQTGVVALSTVAIWEFAKHRLGAREPEPRQPSGPLEALQSAFQGQGKSQRADARRGNGGGRRDKRNDPEPSVSKFGLIVL